MDNDSLSTLSRILGHYGDGVLDGLDFKSSLKNMEGIFLLKLRDKINLFERFYSIYRYRIEALKYLISRTKKWDYIIVDNYVGILEDDPIIRSIYEISQLRIGVFLTDKLSLDSSIEYSNNWNQLDSKFIILVNENREFDYDTKRMLFDIILNLDINDFTRYISVADEE
ncbi:ParA family protein [Sulfolobus tengchongensis]|uniref:ParA family protein n=1 Tax=Sulfolobus tengchongensis TaxID=207809 RepID=UPI003BAE683E